MPPPLERLPTELMLQVIENLETADIVNLVCSSCSINDRLGKEILVKDARTEGHALFVAARRGRLDLAEKALAAGTPIDKHFAAIRNKCIGAYHTALFVAISRCHFGVAKFLVEKGADVNKPSFGDSALTTWDLSQTPIITLIRLLAWHQRTQEEGTTFVRVVITDAERAHGVELLRMLLEKGVSTNVLATDLSPRPPQPPYRNRPPPVPFLYPDEVAPLHIAMFPRVPAEAVALLLKHNAYAGLAGMTWGYGPNTYPLVHLQDAAVGEKKMTLEFHKTFAAKAKLLRQHMFPFTIPDQEEDDDEPPCARTRSTNKQIQCHICGHNGSGPWCPFVTERFLR